MEATKPVQQAFGSSGGKSRLAKKIVGLMPPHSTYVEPFAGGAAVYFYKDPAHSEVLNDMDKGIVFAYRFLRGMTPNQYEEVKRKNWRITREQYDKVKAMKSDTDVDRFYKFYYLKKGSYRSKDTVNVGNIGKTIGVERLPKVKERLKRVSLENADALRMIDKYDSPTTLFYLDPPYPSTTRVVGDAPDFTTEDLRKLTDRLKHIKGRFILSMDTTDAKDFPVWMNVRRVKTGGPDGEGIWRSRFEVVATNYNPAEVKAKGYRPEFQKPRQVLRKRKNGRKALRVSPAASVLAGSRR